MSDACERIKDIMLADVMSLPRPAASVEEDA